MGPGLEEQPCAGAVCGPALAPPHFPGEGPDTGEEAAPAPGGLRACEVARPEGGGPCGFHLSRTHWDPYPWVSGVDAGSAAEAAGLLAGDCVLRVNGQAVLGERIGSVAARVRALPGRVALLLWNPGADPAAGPESPCGGPMPAALQRLLACAGAVAAALECPVCLEPVAPPAHQCAHGHLICVRCRVRTERCPVCRLRFCRGRSLLADRCFQALSDAFGLHAEAEEARPARLRERLLGARKKPPAAGGPQGPVKPPAAANRLLARLLGKASSVENLARAGAGQRGFSPDAEFNSLKAKSLSTSEIFRPLSPTPSRAGSCPGSCRGSRESLAGDGPAPLDDGSLFHCPSCAQCCALLPAAEVLAHARRSHGGPLLQFFRPRVPLTLPPPPALAAALLVASGADGATLFVRAEPQPGPGEGGWLLWLWLLGSKRSAAAYSAAVTLWPGSGAVRREVPVLSLASASWQDVARGRRGLVLAADWLRERRPATEPADGPIEAVLEVCERAGAGGCSSLL